MMTPLLKPLIILSLFLFFGCDSQPSREKKSAAKKEVTVLLISKDNGGHIKDWMQLLNHELTIKECYGLSDDSLNFYLKIADAMIIGGGNDVNPALYNKPEYTSICGKFDNYRDTLELKMIRFAASQQVPIMGICRGQQLLNVAHGGSLIPDLPTYIKGDIMHRSKKDSAHLIIPVKGSWINNAFQEEFFWVNSRHHQAIAKLAKGFEVVAYSPDRVIEAISIHSNSTHPFTMGVQFHPENLRDSLSNHFGMLLLNSIQ
jgi:putative glutamine amidotransferase